MCLVEDGSDIGRELGFTADLSTIMPGSLVSTRRECFNPDRRAHIIHAYGISSIDMPVSPHWQLGSNQHSNQLQVQKRKRWGMMIGEIGDTSMPYNDALLS